LAPALAASLAPPCWGHYAAIGEKKVNALTLMVSVLDTTLDSDVALFVDEQTLEAAKRHSYQAGVLEGRDMAKVFAWMRPNDLIWNYWVNNYLLGNEPPVFDILFWNNDTTRLPAAFHGDLIEMFKNNPLIRPNALEVCGTPIDLKQVTADIFFPGPAPTITSPRGSPATSRHSCSVARSSSCCPAAGISRAS